MVFTFEDIIYNPDMYNFALPFLLIFAIVFAILEKTAIFGKEYDPKIQHDVPRRNINAIVALVFGLLLVTQLDIVEKLHNFIPKVSFFIVIAVMVLLLFALFGIGTTGASGWVKWLLIIIILLALYWALGPTLEFYFPPFLEDMIYSNQIIVWIILIVLIAGVFGFGGYKYHERRSGKSEGEPGVI